MRALAVACLLVALLGAAVSAKRIHRLHAELQAQTLEPKADLETKAGSLLTGPALKYDDIRKMFNDNVVKIAADQKKPAKRIVGTWETSGVVRTCTNGNCKEFGPDVVYDNGSKGVISAVLTPAANGKPEQIDILFNYNWASCQIKDDVCATHFTCFNVGRSTEADGSTKCEHSTYFYHLNYANPITGRQGLFNSAPSFSASDDAKYMKRNSIRLTAKGLLVVREYYDTYGSGMLHTVRHIRGTFAADAFVNPSYMADSDYVKELRPDMAAILSGASTKVLTTQQIIQKFFTADNIDLARMQGPSVPVKAVIGAYSTAYFEKRCNQGVCNKWAAVDLVNAKNMFGGEGSVALTCSVPTDLTKASCEVTMTMKGSYGWEYQAFAICPKVGGAVTKCNGAQSCPSYFSLGSDSATGRSFWSRTNFVRDVVEADEFYFTDERLVARWKWKGQTPAVVGAPSRLQYSQLIAYSTPFSDFGSAAKTNCLSKTTADAVLKAAAEKKGLKNKIVLQSAPVQELIKNAPYKSIDEAIVKIKGIGPVNVIYVSFMWNFFC